MCPFFADQPFKCAFFERVTKKVHENQQAKSWASYNKTYHNKKKFVLCLVLATFKEQVDKLSLVELAK